MTERQARKMFVNLAVRDLEKSKTFFAKLGFAFDPELTGDKAACLAVSDQAHVMLLRDAYFGGFTKRERCDTSTHSEGIFAFTCNSRSEVDELVKRAFAAGATPAMDPKDYDRMYSLSFYDLDGHHWEVFCLNPNAA